jgi:putative membrane protein
MTRTTPFATRIPTKSSVRPTRTALAVALLLGFAGALAVTGSARAADLAHADKKFMEQAAQNNMTEIQASKVALEKSSSSAVKEFANMMVTDHTKTGDEMRALATSKGVKVPEDPSAMQKAKIAVMGKLTGQNFDKQYANIVGVHAHEDTVKLFRKASTNAKDPDVKAFATKTLPALEHHLEMAKALKATTDATKGNTAAMSRSNDMPAPGTNAGTGATGAMMGTPGSSATGANSTTSGAAMTGTNTAAHGTATTTTSTKSKSK